MFQDSVHESAEEGVHGFRVHVFRMPLDGGNEVAFFAFDGFDDAVSCPCGRAEALGEFLDAFSVAGVDVEALA